MKKLISILFLIVIVSNAFSQNDTVRKWHNEQNRYVFWFIPSASRNIYGIALGFVGSEVICNRPYTKYSHGLNLQIGQGFLQTFMVGRFNFDSISTYNNDTLYKRIVHNGILVSIFGTFSNQINGISMSGWMSMNEIINGISCNLLWNLQKQVNGISIGLVNTSMETSGLQIGIVNKSKLLKGFQIGIWNINDKRSLPIINWNFKKSTKHNKAEPPLQALR